MLLSRFYNLPAQKILLGLVIRSAVVPRKQFFKVLAKNFKVRSKLGLRKVSQKIATLLHRKTHII